MANNFNGVRHAIDFMEAAKKLQFHLIGLQREDEPSRAETLRKLINKHEKLIQGWRKELKDQLDKQYLTELGESIADSQQSILFSFVRSESVGLGLTKGIGKERTEGEPSCVVSKNLP
ncbi:hypothetical protein G4B88_016510 [Cannabis sativa]|uniref:Uncharacterized protein n=1 Tax=Cannabis sativa TaxID=3483 RepID=A0A7J6H9G4_CANSA|nr:hypothetical protein G4B88_016510 [Cannabis sativa]